MKIFLLFVVFSMISCFGLCAQDDCMHISEVMVNPLGGECGGAGIGQEYVLVTNGGSTSIPLAGWRLVEWDESAFGNAPGLSLSLSTQNEEGISTLMPGETITFVFCRQTANCTDCAVDVSGDSNLNNNEGDEVYLFSPSQSIPSASFGSFNPSASDYTSRMILGADPNPGGNVATQSAPAACSVVPIELLSFEVKDQVDGNILAWTTLSEIDNDFFVIERSFEGSEWNEVGKITGSGSTFEVNSYRFVDEGVSCPSESIYYRLRQIDFDGSFTLSPVRSVVCRRSSEKLTVYPNPANSSIRVASQAENMEVFIFGLEGRLLGQHKITSSTEVDISYLNSGLYVVRVVSEQKSKDMFFRKL